MRVLILTNLYPSPERPAWGTFVRSQVESLADEGIVTKVFCIDGSKSRLNYFSAIRQLRRIMCDEKFDLIHAHYGFSGWVALTQSTLPVVISYMGDDLLGTPRADGSLAPLSRVYAWVNRRLAGRFAAVIVKSTEMRAMLERSDVHVIPNGVDMQLFRPGDRYLARESLNLPSGTLSVLFAADPSIPRKRFDLAVRAVEIVAQTRPCELYPVFGRPQGELVTWMNACDALIFPSWIEGSPNAVKEAMACNLPIVASDAGDIPELLTRGEGNHSVHLTTAPESLGQNIDQQAVAMAEALSVVMDGDRSTSRAAMQDLSLPAVARQLRGIYENVLA